ncbi:MAG: DUF898 family protein [Deltaproteobacteria bacterium]|nr:DUF898 family protein [Deltaproteobacteria bacterium]
MPEANCRFSGSGGQYFGTVFIHLFLLSMITFGLYSPWALVRLYKLKATHTVINGKRVNFNGTGGDLFVLGLIQGLITLVTFGLYFPWAFCSIYRWRAQNTLVGGKPSTFTGTGGDLFLFYLIHMMILPMITLGIYSFWGLYRFYAWKEEHMRYGGEKTSFGAGFGGFLKVSILSYLLNTFTFNILTPWTLCMLFKWQINGLVVGNEGEVEHFPPVKTNIFVVTILIVLGLALFAMIALFVRSQLLMVWQLKSQMATMQMGMSGQKRVYRVPGAQPPPSTRKPTLKPRLKTAPDQPTASSKRPGVAEGRVKPGIDIQLEMKRINSLIQSNDRNEDAFFNRGWLYAYRGDLAEAERDYSRVIRLNPGATQAYYNRALVYVRMKKFDQAIRDFSQVLKQDPRNTRALCNRGNAYFESGRPDLALRDYAEALRISPNDGDIYFNRASVYLAQGKTPEATADIRKAASLGHKEAANYLRRGLKKPKS